MEGHRGLAPERTAGAEVLDHSSERAPTQMPVAATTAAGWHEDGPSPTPLPGSSARWG